MRQKDRRDPNVKLVMDLTLRQVRCFVAIADAGTFSLAAAPRSIFRSSAVTVLIQSLEAKTGIKLFKRHSRGVNLTRDGYLFLSLRSKILAAVSDASQVFKDFESESVGYRSIRNSAAGGRVYVGAAVRQLSACLSQRQA